MVPYKVLRIFILFLKLEFDRSVAKNYFVK